MVSHGQSGSGTPGRAEPTALQQEGLMAGESPAPGISGHTRVFGVMGYPVAHSLSPLMHNRAFAVRGYPGVYVPLPVHPQQVEAAVAGIRALGLAGVNVTVPHKQAVMPFLDEVSLKARRIGAVNTIINRDGRLLGENTDGQGFLRSFQEELGRDFRSSRVVILGAGGAARALAVELLMAGVSRLLIANRTEARARALVADLKTWNEGPARVDALGLQDERLAGEVRQADVVIQASSWGMSPHDDAPSLIPPEWLQPGTAVCDIVYTPAETGLLKAARERGCPTLAGLGMLLHQGAAAFELWTGLPAPVAEMRQVLEERLYGRYAGA